MEIKFLPGDPVSARSDGLIICIGWSDSQACWFNASEAVGTCSFKDTATNAIIKLDIKLENVDSRVMEKVPNGKYLIMCHLESPFNCSGMTTKTIIDGVVKWDCSMAPHFIDIRYHRKKYTICTWKIHPKTTQSQKLNLNKAFSCQVSPPKHHIRKGILILEKRYIYPELLLIQCREKFFEWAVLIIGTFRLILLILNVHCSFFFMGSD